MRWHGDRLLLSAHTDAVRFAAGSILYEQDLDGFLASEYPPEVAAAARKVPWLAALSRYELPFSMRLAGRLVLVWGENLAVCAFLERFGFFYSGNRMHLEAATRELRLVLDGLLTLRSRPALSGPLAESLGEVAAAWLSQAGAAGEDVPAFLGRLLAEPAGVCPLPRLPEALRALAASPREPVRECLRVPHYRRALETLERSAERAAPLLERLRAAMGAPGVFR